MRARGLFINPVKCSAAIDMAYLGKHGLYRLCSFSALSGGILELLLERCCIILIVMLVKKKKKRKKSNLASLYWLQVTFIAGGRSSVSFLSADGNLNLISLVVWTFVLLCNSGYHIFVSHYCP